MRTKPKLIKLVDLEYNETLTIALIEKDEQLRMIFADELKLPFALLITLSKEDKLNEDTKNLLFSIFDEVVLTQSDLIRKYRELAYTNNISLSERKNEELPITEEVELPTVVDETPEKNEVIVTETISEEIRNDFGTTSEEPIKEVKKPKQKKEKELPRRYGKEKILEDVKKQGGKPTPLQNAMLRVNDLKNIYVNLQARGIKDMLGGTNLLSDTDCRDITSAITIIERKLESILKRKK
jgi:hypothetical protein